MMAGKRNTRTQHGLTLIEVLVAVVVLSVGLLGVASLQLASLRESNRSNERSLATILAYDIADRMRANIQGTANGKYLISASTSPDAPTVSGNATALDYCRTDFTNTSTANICNGSEMAMADIYDWRMTVQNSLPGGVGQIQCADADNTDADDCSAGSTFLITVMWDEQRSGNTGTGCDPGEATDLLCLTITTEL